MTWRDIPPSTHRHEVLDMKERAAVDRRRRLAYSPQRGVGHKGTNRVLRGGSWNNPAENVRAAYRNRNDPSNRNPNYGFRLSRAHRRCGGIVDDPAAILSAGAACGEKPTAPGVLVVRSAESFDERSPGVFCPLTRGGRR